MLMPMATHTEVRPNRRGVKSRELVLDAAERVMAQDGFEAATLARVVEEAGIPMSSVYHYYGSKEGILLAVMERGAERFFADLPESGRRVGSAKDYLTTIISTAADTLERHPSFLRLLIVFAAQPVAVAGGEVQDVVARVRALGVQRLQREIALAFDDEPDSATTIHLARFALAAFDGAFIAAQADRSLRLSVLLAPLAPAMIAARRALLREHH
jgi:AcrR family transcriptional regulator